MPLVEYKAQLLPDGHLSCPERVKKQLRLTNGSQVKVLISSLEERQVIKLKGLWCGVEIAEEEIDIARKEMWGRLEKQP